MPKRVLPQREAFAHRFASCQADHDARKDQRQAQKYRVAAVQVLHRGMVIPMDREMDGEDFRPELLTRRGLGQFWNPHRDKAQRFGDMVLPYRNHPVMMTIEHPGPDFEDADTASRNRPIPGWDEGQVVLKKGTPVRVLSIQSNGQEYLDKPRVMEI